MEAKSFWEQLFVSLSGSYYTLFPLTIVCSYSLFKLLSTHNYDSNKKIFTAYLISVLFLFIVGTVVNALPFLTITTRLKFVELSNSVFGIVETYVFSNFFISILNKKSIKILVKITYLAMIAFGLAALFYQLLNPNWRMNLLGYHFTTIHLFAFSVLSLYYFYEVYQMGVELKIDLTLKVFALFSYSIVSVPYFLLEGFLDSQHQIQINNLFYAFHYLLITFLCYSLSVQSFVKAKHPDSSRELYNTPHF